MKTPSSINREPAALEKHAPWLAVGCGGSAVICCVTTGLFTLGVNMRGYTFWGVLLGIAAVVLAVLAGSYSLRKRLFQERIPAVLARRKGTMMVWLWAHVYLGILALAAAVFHAGFGLTSFNFFSTGNLLFLVFALLIVSGIAWRLVYKVVPPKARQEIMNYSREDSQERARERLVEIEKLSAGKSAGFQQVKEWLVQGVRPSVEIDQAAARLDADEQAAVGEIKQLVAGRERALQRFDRQGYYTRILQGSRWLHIPLVGAFVILLGIHIVAVSDIPAQIFPAQLGGFRPAEECGDCHAAIYAQWQESMHAHALTSPVTIVQTNQVIETTLAGTESPDPKQICNNCHGPVQTMMTGQADLPLEPPPFVSEETINEGVNCATCHQFEGEPVSAGGGWASIFQEDLRPGRVYFGPSSDSAGNAKHHTRTTPMFEQPETLCLNCHNVNVDRDGDGQIVAGIDLVLQNTYNEFLEYQAAGGTESCITCHMPVMVDETRQADDAFVPFEQDPGAPERIIHNHGFVGVDYPLDTVAESDPQREAREELLQSAALLELGEVFFFDDQTIGVEVLVTNNDLGHYLPTGFAFARQMWLEVVVTDEFGGVLFTSGVLNSNTDDLCDAGTMDDPGNPMAVYIEGCAFSDPQLVNFQQKLVDDWDLINGQLVQAGQETWLQNLNGGAVSRIRPIDEQLLTRIEPNETRRFVYLVPTFNSGQANISVRLRFRNLPPYFLRALADHQTADEEPQIFPLISNLIIVDMASFSESFNLQ
jgi:hypothetical protein